MSKKRIVLMLGAAIAAGFAGYKVGCRKHYCCFCQEPEFEPENESEEEGDHSENESEAEEREKLFRRMMAAQMLKEMRQQESASSSRRPDQDVIDALMVKVRPELLAYILHCDKDE